MFSGLFKKRAALATPATIFGDPANRQAGTGDTATSDFQVSLQGLSVPNGTHVTVVVSGDVVCAIPVRGGDASLQLRSGNGDGDSAIEAGERVEIRCGQDVLVRGVFRFD